MLTLRPLADALGVLLEPATVGEGGRLGVIGAPGSGKTRAAVWLLRQTMRRRVCGLALVLDDKGRRQQYPGEPRTTPADIAARPPSSSVVVLRGDPRAGVVADGEGLAALALRVTRSTDVPVMLVVDELDRVLTDGGRSWTAPSVREVITQGRALGAWLLWTTQQPHRLPAEPIDLATAVLFGRLEGRAVQLLERVHLLPRMFAATLPTLERGQFLLLRPGHPWVPEVYFLTPEEANDDSGI